MMEPTPFDPAPDAELGGLLREALTGRVKPNRSPAEQGSTATRACAICRYLLLGHNDCLARNPAARRVQCLVRLIERKPVRYLARKQVLPQRLL